MANFFEKTLRFQLVDVEGVLLGVGASMIINEPEDLGDVKISIKRDQSTKGFFFEFSDEETPFIFDKVRASGETYSGYELLTAIKYAKGSDGQCQFLIQENTGSWITIYTGELDFGNQYMETDYSVQILSRRVTLGDKFRTRKEVPIDFGASTSVDGNAVTGLTPSSMHLHSKVIQQVQKATCTQLADGGGLNTNENWFLQWDYKTEIASGFLNTLEDNYGGDVDTILYENLIDMPANYAFDFKQGELRIKVDADFNCIAENMTGETITLVGLYAEVNGTEFEILSINDTFNVTDPLGLELKVFTYSADGRINIPEGANVKIYEKWTLPDTGSAHSVNFTVNAGHVATFTFNDIAENSTADVYNIKDALNHVIESICDQSSTVVSDFLDNTADQVYVTNGYLLRKFSDRTPKFSFDDLFSKFINKVFGLGFSLLFDNGVAKCVIERFSYFYQDTEIIYISDIIDDSYERRTDTDIIYNQIDTGFSVYPSSTDDQDSNNIDDFNTIHKHVTPIQRQMKRGQFVSDAIASGYKIENQRRQQFNKTPKKQGSDDDKLFTIIGVNTNSYQISRLTGDPANVIFSSTENKIKLYGAFFDVRIETINITGTGMTNAGNYTVSNVERDGAYTVLSVGSVAGDENFSDDFTITLASTRLRASRNDEFETVSGVVDPSTIYNAGINPKYILMNNSTLFNSGFVPKPSTETMKTQEAKLNEDATFRFKAGEGAYALDPDRVTVVMGGDLQLSQLNHNTALLEGNQITFEAIIPYSSYLSIRDALTDYNNANLHGYIRFRSPDGTDKMGFPDLVTYELGEEKATFVLREKFISR